MVISAKQDVDAAEAAAQCVVRTHERLVEYLQVGRTLAQIDQFVAEVLSSLDCRSAFLRYRMKNHPPFSSHACLSLNDCIVHGTHDMSTKPLGAGDILSVDIGVVHRGWIGDAAWTYAIGEASDEALQLMACGRESLQRGIDAVKAGRPLLDWARALQPFVEQECGFHLIRGLGGHGYGRTLHGPPFISNVTPRHPGEWPDARETFKPGMLLAVEPMIAVGSGEIISDGRTWPIYTADGSLSVHYEADIMVTENGARDLTAGMNCLPDIVR
ncbi:MAG: type I methionyl aminopeptidase [Planctomycetes bacterium]|nr:type I methionyl aminopeptidase [Planctomycetota bacterium]